MFERWITRRHDRTRLEGSVLYRQLLSFAETLESEGYQPLTLRRYMFAAAAFGRWIDRQGWTIEEVDESRWQRYLTGRRRHRHRGRRHGRLSNSVSGVHKFVAVLRVRGAMPAMTIRERGPIDEVVAAFDSHLSRVAGLAVGTRRIYRLYARGLLVAFDGGVSGSHYGAGSGSTARPDVGLTRFRGHCVRQQYLVARTCARSQLD